jgi:hypothetical protein
MRKGLAVHSSAAIPFNRGELRLMAAIGQKFGVSLVKTGADHAPVDAIWTRKGTCIGCSEHKVRQTSRAEMRQFGDTYLITEQKLVDGMRVGSLLGVPFYVVALLLPDGLAYAWKMMTHEGEPLVTWQSAETVTQATCEGGKATRVNAYLPFAQAMEFRVGSIHAALKRIK